MGDLLVYADDIVCWSNNRGYLERPFTCWKRCFEEAGLPINIQKTELSTVTKLNEDIEEIRIENEHNSEVTSVKYIGCMFTSNRDKNKRENRKNNKVQQRSLCLISYVKRWKH